MRYILIQNLTFCTDYIKYILRKKKYSMSSVSNKKMKLLYLTKTYFRMEIFLRKVAEYTELGKRLL